MNSIEQALKIAEQHNISRSATDVPAEELPDSEMFLLGRWREYSSYLQEGGVSFPLANQLFSESSS